MSPFSVADPPYLRKEESAQSLAVKTFLAALLPIAARISLAPVPALLQALGVAAGIFFARAVLSRFFSIQRSGGLWVSISLGAILTALLPAQCPFWISLTGGAAMIFLGPIFSGGYAKLVFHPAAMVCLLLADTQSQNIPGTVFHYHLILFLAASAGGALLLFLRVIDWKIPAIFLGTISLGLLTGITLQEILFEGRLAVLGFFILTDPATTPLRAAARMKFSLFTAAAALLLAPFLSMGQAALTAVLFMNAACAYFDSEFK